MAMRPYEANKVIVSQNRVFSVYAHSHLAAPPTRPAAPHRGAGILLRRTVRGPAPTRPVVRTYDTARAREREGAGGTKGGCGQYSTKHDRLRRVDTSILGGRWWSATRTALQGSCRS